MFVGAGNGMVVRSSEALGGQDAGLQSSWGDILIKDHFLARRGETSLGVQAEFSQ